MNTSDSMDKLAGILFAILVISIFLQYCSLVNARRECAKYDPEFAQKSESTHTAHIAAQVATSADNITNLTKEG